jgi:anhydro-N-acetylmuramic acid kinase
VNPVRLAVGCMSGTSCDGVDAAAVLVEGALGRLRARVVGFAGVPLGEAGRSLKRISLGTPASASEIARLVRELSGTHVSAIDAALLAARGATENGPPVLIACHGQTLHHGGGLSWQAFQPAPIAHHFGVPVVHDLRAADLAAGGEGAPITPLADAVLYNGHRPMAVVNLGGFCNMTTLGTGSGIGGRDICPCNQLLDAAAEDLLGQPFDPDGRCALAGVPDTERSAVLSGALADLPGSSRSLGSGDEHTSLLGVLDGLEPRDALATLADSLGRTIASAPPHGVAIVLAGGGARNTALADAIRRHAPASRVAFSDEFGVPSQAREAAAMAVLGLLSLDGLAITDPGVTRVASPAPVSGSWTLPPDGSWVVARRPPSGAPPDHPNG